MGLELSTSAEPLAGEGRVGEVWAEGRLGAEHKSCLIPLGEHLPSQPQFQSLPASVEEKVGRGEC